MHFKSWLILILRSSSKGRRESWVSFCKSVILATELEINVDIAALGKFVCIRLIMHWFIVIDLTYGISK